MSRPSTSTLPAEGRSTPPNRLSSVDLPGARRAEQRDLLPGLDVEVHPAQRDDVVAARGGVDLHDVDAADRDAAHEPGPPEHVVHVLGTVLDGRHRPDRLAGVPAVDEVQLVVAQVGDLRVVGGQHDDGAAVGLRAQLGHHQVAVVLVELAGRLVGQQHVGLHGQRPRHRDPLELAAGELGDQPLGEVADPDPLQGRPGPGRRPRPGATRAGAQGDRDVLLGGQAGTRP